MYNDKMIKNIIPIFILMVVVIFGINSFSYAYLKKEIDTGERLDIQVANLNYNMKLENLDDNVVLVPANDYINFKIDFTSLNKIDSKYQFYYELTTNLSSTEKNKLDVGYFYLSDESSSGNIMKDSSKEIIISIINGNSKDINLKIGVKGGLVNNEIKLDTNQYKIEKSKALIDYSGNNYYGTFMNGADIIYDNEEGMYAIDFDGINDYVDIVDLPASIDWENGFTVEFTAKWDELNNWSRIFDFGNGQADNNVLVANYGVNKDLYLGGRNSLGEQPDFIFENVIDSIKNYKLVMSKINENMYTTCLYIFGKEISCETLEKSEIIKNILRTKNYLGRSNWEVDKYFNGKIYNLKITEKDGDVVLWYNPSMIFEFDYNNAEQEIIIPISGSYKIETWGSSGGGKDETKYGYGGYTSGVIDLKSNSSIYVYTGEAGKLSDNLNQNVSSTFNGGGEGSKNAGGYLSSGGGATDIRIKNGSWDSFDSLKSRIMVAAGGGGGIHYNTAVYEGREGNSYEGGSAGGLSGYNGHVFHSDEERTQMHADPVGASQISGGPSNSVNKGSFGKAGLTGGSSSGAGGGYYGGEGGYDWGWSPSSGAGGSSFISGHDGCDAIDSSSTSSNIIHTGQSIHYSGLYFTDTVMIDGAGYKWTDKKEGYVGQPQPNGEITTGHIGNGYARITYLSK